MSEHRHTERVEGCFRCELGEDEARKAEADEPLQLYRKYEVTFQKGGRPFTVTGTLVDVKTVRDRWRPWKRRLRYVVRDKEWYLWSIDTVAGFSPTHEHMNP